MRPASLLVFIYCLIIGGCSLDYREAAESDELLESVPDLVLKRFIHTSVNGERLVFQLEAARAEMFSRKKYTTLTNVRFIGI
ncbi:MAG TPA: hypothetical protein ENN69_08015 [Spirochaetia bacterium]|nr:hypothetical protein [Spirochaetia bacterium]